jgi:hypothetical protein
MVISAQKFKKVDLYFIFNLSKLDVLKKGYSFGVSREYCKNLIDPLFGLSHRSPRHESPLPITSERANSNTNSTSLNRSLVLESPNKV